MFNKLVTRVTSALQQRLRNRLEKVSTDELVRWLDNTHTGMGMNVQELRKSLTHDDKSQALVYVEDMRKGATTILAAMDVLEDRLSPETR